VAFKHHGDLFFQLNFQASVFLAFLLNVCTFYCTTLNTARTQTVRLAGRREKWLQCLRRLRAPSAWLLPCSPYGG
jgi:hypothetical protein